MLLEHNAEINERDNCGNTAVIKAVNHSQGYDTKKVEEEQILDIIRIFQANEANLEFKNNDNKSALWYADDFKLTKVARYLRKSQRQFSA